MTLLDACAGAFENGDRSRGSKHEMLERIKLQQVGQLGVLAVAEGSYDEEYLVGINFTDIDEYVLGVSCECPRYGDGYFCKHLWATIEKIQLQFSVPFQVNRLELYEACFREAKEELGWDHFECRGWGCVHRHLIVTIVSQLFCARVRHQLCRSEVVSEAERLTLEQVRRASDVYIRCMGLPRRIAWEEYQAELNRIDSATLRRAETARNALRPTTPWESILIESKASNKITMLHECKLARPVRCVRRCIRKWRSESR